MCTVYTGLETLVSIDITNECIKRNNERSALSETGFPQNLTAQNSDFLVVRKFRSSETPGTGNTKSK
jgi:hypothetical protein